MCQTCKSRATKIDPATITPIDAILSRAPIRPARPGLIREYLADAAAVVALFAIVIAFLVVTP